MDQSDTPDEDLVALICQGHQSAFSVLVKRHTNRYLALAVSVLDQRSDAEDAVQAAFIKLWIKPNSYQSDQAKFSTWFYRVVLNECRDLQRKQSSRSTLFDRVLNQPQVRESISEESKFTERDQTDRERTALAMAIGSLPSKQREALSLSIYSELSQRDIAIAMHTTVKSVESHLVRARKSLKLVLEKIDAEELTSNDDDNLVSKEKVLLR